MNQIDDSVDPLPKYHIRNDSRLSSILLQVSKVVSPLSDRFASEESCLEPDAKNWMVIVELRRGLENRRVRIERKPEETESSTRHSVCVQLQDQAPRQLKENMKSAIRLLLQSGKDSPSMKDNQELKTCLVPDQREEVDQKKKQLIQSGKDAPRVKNSQVLKMSLVADQREEMDKQLIQSGKDAPSVKNSQALKMSLVADQREEMDKQLMEGDAPNVPEKQAVKLIQMDADLSGNRHEAIADPRLVNGYLKRIEARKCLDLPLPRFGCPASPPVGETQRPIEVIVGVSRDLEPGGQDRSTRVGLVESLQSRLFMLDDGDFYRLMSEFQRQITAVLLHTV